MKLRIALVSNQVRGIDGTGGLGDVAAALPRALTAQEGAEVHVIMPGYQNINGQGLEGRFSSQSVFLPGLEVPWRGRAVSVDVHRLDLNRLQPNPRGRRHAALPCYLLRCPEVFDAHDPGTGLNDKNSPQKAVFLARSALEFLRAARDICVDVIQCNDWHSGLIPVLLRTVYREDNYLRSIATLYTTHNSGGDAYQGAFPNADELLRLGGLTDEEFRPMQTQSLHHFGKFNFTKGGIGFADVVNTVSRQYRRELLSSVYAGGLEGVFLERSEAFHGIENGLDYREWDPENDPELAPWNYSAEQSAEAVVKAKRRARRKLREWNGGNDANPFRCLRDDSIAVGIVTRIDYQKAPIFVRALDDLLREVEDCQILMIGQADAHDQFGKEHYERPLRDMAAKYHERFLFLNGFNIALSHLVYAVSQVFLVPSTFEPCGLTQLAAMRYGAVPVCRDVGGMHDSIVSEPANGSNPLATGFLFRESLRPGQLVDEAAGALELVSTVKRAIVVMRESPGRWGQILRNGMLRDSSWRVPARLYARLFAEAVQRHFHDGRA